MRAHGDGFDPLTCSDISSPGIIALSIRRCLGAVDGGLILFTAYAALFDPDSEPSFTAKHVMSKSLRGKSPEDRG